jgi:hypothetical protein
MDQKARKTTTVGGMVSCGNAFVTSDDAGLVIHAPRDHRAFVHGKRMTTL